jgi:hypothetical protein
VTDDAEFINVPAGICLTRFEGFDRPRRVVELHVEGSIIIGQIETARGIEPFRFDIVSRKFLPVPHDPQA